MTRNALPDDIHSQGARLIAWLRANGRTSCPVLTSSCDVPSVTKRVCELIEAGWPIQRTRGHVLTPSGVRRRSAFYELIGAHAQGDLFTRGNT
jgi:Helix-turn-helix domain